jgi:hypothetical protein
MIYIIIIIVMHSWASASRKLTPASAFRYQYFQSGTGSKNAGLPWLGPVPDLSRHQFFLSGTGLIGCRTVRGI